MRQYVGRRQTNEKWALALFRWLRYGPPRLTAYQATMVFDYVDERFVPKSAQPEEA